MSAQEELNGLPAEAVGAPNFKECRHCGFECRPNPNESKKFYPLEQASTTVQEGEPNDTQMLEWLQFHGARVSWSMDSEFCSVRWTDRDGEKYRTRNFIDWRTAIKAAMNGEVRNG